MPPSASTILNRFTLKAKFRQMQVLVSLAEQGSMRRAAVALNMTQPAVSLLVAELEKLLETQLFLRHAKGVAPTEAARILLPVARRIMAALEEGAEGISNHLQHQGGTVRISATPAAIGGLLYGVLDGFSDRHPDIQLHISQAAGQDPLGAISEDAADIVCTRQPAALPEGWVFEQCLQDALVAVAAREHPLASSEPLLPEELGTVKWLLHRAGSAARGRFDEAAEASGWPATARCRIIMHVPELTKEMLLTGKYLALLPRSVALPWISEGKVVELITPLNTPMAPLGFLWRNSAASAACQAFAGHLKAQHCDNNSQAAMGTPDH